MAITYGKNYGRPTLDLNFAENKSLIDSVTGRNLITFSRSQSGKEATYVGSDGLIKYAGADEPRFDYDPETGESLGLLIEEQRTNLMIRSEEFDSSHWVSGGNIPATTNVTPNQTIAPNGLTTADLIKLSTTTSRFGVGVDNRTSVSADTTYTLSVFVKAKELSRVWVGYWSLTSGSQHLGSFNLSTQSWYGTDTTGTRSYEVFPDGWFRLIFTFTTGIIGGRTISVLIPNPDGTSTSRNLSDTSLFYDGTPYAGQGLYLWGFQLEAASFPTSYIPTSGSTVTRNADEASITGTNFSSWYNQSEGTIFHDGRYIGDVLGGNYGVINGLIFYFRNTGLDNFANQWSLGIYRAAGISNPPNHSSALYNGTTLVLLNVADQLANNPVGSRMKSVGFINTSTGEFGHVLNGGTIRSNSNTNIPIWDKLSISQAYNNQSRCGHISRFTYWPKRLPDLELQQLTK